MVILRDELIVMVVIAMGQSCWNGGGVIVGAERKKQRR